jgi:hypothetical protein
VVDTNLYTDPIYNIFKRPDMAGELAVSAISKLMTSVSIIWQTKKRIPSDLSDPAAMGQWNRYKRISSKAHPRTPDAMSDLMNRRVEPAAHQKTESRIK